MISLFKKPILAGLLMSLMVAPAVFGTDVLSRVAQKGDAATVRALLEAGSSPKMQDLSGWTSLHSAALRGSGEIVKMLLEAGGDPNHQLRDCVYGDYKVACGLELNYGNWSGLRLAAGSTPLHIAAACGHLEAVQALLNASARHDLCDANGQNPLHMASSRSLLSELQCIVTPDVRTAHDLVAQRNFSEIVRVLLDAHACPDAQSEGWTPLHAAAFGRHAEAVRMLLDVRVPYDCQTSCGATPLYKAAFSCCLDIVHLLLAAGANPNLSLNQDAEATHGGGAAPLHVAVDSGSVEMVRSLLDAGAHVNAQNICGMTPLVVATVSGHGNEFNHKIIRLLLERGADPNLSTNTNPVGGDDEDAWPSDCTPLSLSRDEYIAHTLLSAGANVHAEGQEGHTPLHHAAMLGKNGCDIRLLLKAGADHGARDHTGKTPLQAVAGMSDDELARWDHTPGFLPVEFGDQRRQAVRDLLQAGSPMD